MFRPFREVPQWWLPMTGAAAGALIVAVIVLVGEAFRLAPPIGSDRPPAPLGQRDGAVHLAGTGTWLPLARVLASAFERAHPDTPVVVHKSVGSRGGKRAIIDGVIDIGLISHPEHREISLDCCKTIPIALAAVVFAVNDSVTATSLTHEQVLSIFSGRTKRWPDGQTLVPLLREQHDSSTHIASKAISGFGREVHMSRQRGLWPVLLTDAEMERALVTTPGSVGLFDQGAIIIENLSIRALAFDGVSPTADALANGTYPLRRVLTMLVSRHPRPETRAFLDFVRSPEGLAVVGAGGAYYPLAEARP